MMTSQEYEAEINRLDQEIDRQQIMIADLLTLIAEYNEREILLRNKCITLSNEIDDLTRNSSPE